MKYRAELDFLTETIKQACANVLSQKMEVRDKGEFDNVTNLDYAMEEFILYKLTESFKDDTFISEEFNSDNLPCGRSWTVDPIDGTVNMAHGISTFGVQAAFLAGETVEVSAIYLPTSKELFTAARGEGAYLNGERISTQERALGSCVVSLGDFSHKRPWQSEQQMRLIGRLRTKVAKMRLYGAACVDFSYLAAGRTDAMIMYTKHLWDIAPGWLLCAEAGARVVNRRGEPYSFGDDEIIAAASEELTALMTETDDN